MQGVVCIWNGQATPLVVIADAWVSYFVMRIGDVLSLGRGL